MAVTTSDSPVSAENVSPRRRLAALSRAASSAAAEAGADPPTQPMPVVAPAWRGRFGRRLARWVPARWRNARTNPGPLGAMTFAAVAALAAIVAAVGVWSDRPVAEPAPPLTAVSVDGSSSGPSAGDPSSAASPGAGLVVSVAGKVVRPGLVTVPDGSRLADVLAAAGGALPGTDVTGLNMARKVADGEQVVVGMPQPAGDQAAGSAGAAAAAAGPGGKVDLNRATLAQLDGLPGVGPVTAQRILDWRTQHTRFARIEQLREVDGIGEKRFSQLRELVTV